MAGIRERMPSLDMVVWLTAVWVLLWGDISWGNVVNGIILAVLVSTVLPLPRVTGLGSYRPLAIGVLVGRFLVDLVHGAIDVSRVALRRTPPRSAVIRVQLRSHSDIVLVTTAGLTSLIPGSVVIEAMRTTTVLGMKYRAERVRTGLGKLAARLRRRPPVESADPGKRG